MSVDHCYSDIGCFPLSDEFYHPRHRPFNVRPWHRRKINTQFLLFNRRYSDGYALKPWDKINLMASHFNPLLETKIIIPGWLDSLDRALWVKRLKDSLLWLWHPVNIIVVHWRNFTPYTVATANTRVVGAELANLLKSIEAELNYDRSYYHAIGHSLGAHIAGYCGDRLPGLGRITALDPARPFFQDMPKSVRLDRGDAKFVDAIHSDFTPENAIFLLMSYGMSTPVGHLDFYPNGHSYLQPGCLRDTLLSIQTGIVRGLEHSSLSLAVLEATRYMTACDHQRSHEWFTESITNRQCTFVGVRCNEFEGLINGRCTCDDSPSACAIMGIHADQMYVHNLHEEIWPLGQRGAGRNRDPRNYRKSRRPAHSVAPPPPPPLQSPSPAPALLMMQPPESLLMDHQQIARPQMDEFVGADIDPVPTRGEIYEKLLQEAARLRQPPMPEPVLSDELYVALDHMDKDTAFINYLKANLMQQHQQKNTIPAAYADIFQQQHTILGAHSSPIPLARPLINRASDEQAEDETEVESKIRRRRGERRFDAADTNHYKDDVELIFSGNNAHPLNKHPKLMSDLDRDIENWYEDSSRWFLKTNNRPNYCVNQYQILIYLGPLKTTNGHKHLRANLLVSVIGSRGNLMNQRFIPRSAKLDSFTMQPFFVILEGSYSLGSILSVAVGWEARVDPDPVQATISFQSSLLENVQASLPAPPRMRPFLGETITFDRSKGFEWRPPKKPGLAKRSPPSSSNSKKDSLMRRSIMVDGLDDQLSEEKCDLENDETGQCAISHSDIMQEAASEEQARIIADLLLAENEQDSIDDDNKQKRHSDEHSPLILAGATADDGGLETGDIDDSYGAELEAVLAAEAAARARLAALNADYDMAPAARPVINLDTAPRPYLKIKPKVNHQKPYGWPVVKPVMPMTHDEFLQEHENRITAKFHNINNLHHLDNDVEDSIVINQIVVNPLHANYGKTVKPSKVFCPARPGQRLKRDQTIRLQPNILGRCQEHQHLHG